MCRRAALALACALLPLAAAAARPKTSKLWGEAGELWQPDGPLMDWSFAGGWLLGSRRGQALQRANRRPPRGPPTPHERAGYKFGAVPLPSPPVTKQLADFQKPGVTDSQAIADMVAWANSQPPDAGAPAPETRAVPATATDAGALMPLPATHPPAPVHVEQAGLCSACRRAS